MVATLGIAITSIVFALIYGIIFQNEYPDIDVLNNSGLITLCAFGGVATTLLIYAIIKVFKGRRVPAK
jgi:hypothetical protein